jgi:REP element-mobilizing transposase RayT
MLGKARDRYGFSRVGYVVMPEPVHLLISEPAKGAPSAVIQVLKAARLAAPAPQKTEARRTIQFDLCQGRDVATGFGSQRTTVRTI